MLYLFIFVYFYALFNMAWKGAAFRMKIGSINIETPLFLAPMAGITDKPFRILCKEQGARFVTTEMVSSRGLFYGDKKTAKLMNLDEKEHPAAIQLFGNDPEVMSYAVKEALKFYPDVIDINMGCPTPKIVGNGDGCALMKNIALAGKVCEAAVKASTVPVTVKFRKGWDDSNINAVEFAWAMQESGASAVAVHGRTREQFYAPSADWDIIAKVKAKVNIPVIGNGDVISASDALKMLKETGCDGVMIGRGALGNPWIFAQCAAALKGLDIPETPSSAQRLLMALRQVEMLVSYKGETVGIKESRKHVSWYLKGMRGASQIKNDVNRAITLEEMKKIILKAIDSMS